MRDWLAVRAHSTPTATALRAAGPLEENLSYADLDECVDTLAGRLARAGVCVDDAVAICAETRPEFITAVHATQRLGAILVPINARLTSNEIETQLDRIDPKVVICERETEPTVAGLTDETALSFDDSAEKTTTITDVSPEPFDLPEWELDDPLVVMFTSGTTGEPNAVVLTLENLLASATASAFRLGVRYDDCWHVPLPLYHMGGLAPVYRSVLYGTSMSIQRGFDPEQTLVALETAEATAVSLVPTMLDRVLGTGTIPELRFVLLGGAPCPPELLKRAQRLGVPVSPTYGMTEAASQIATARPDEASEAPESVGHPLMFLELSVVDGQGAHCETGEPGELVVSGPMITPGYLDEDATDERFVNGGFRTGDRGYRDAAGRVYVLGRVDETIVTGGENVDPSEVSTVLRKHSDVADCAVVGLDDEEWGERVAALVVPTEGREPSVDELVSHCRERLAGYKVPRTLSFTTAIPRTASGTIERPTVVDRLLDETT